MIPVSRWRCMASMHTHVMRTRDVAADRPEMCCTVCARAHSVRKHIDVARFARTGMVPCSGASTHAVANIYRYGVRMASLGMSVRCLIPGRTPGLCYCSLTVCFHHTCTYVHLVNVSLRAMGAQSQSFLMTCVRPHLVCQQRVTMD